MAGLPKRAYLLAFAVALLVIGSVAGTAQETQSPSLVIDPVVQTDSTTLEEVTEAVETNSGATEEERQLLIDLFVAAVDDGGMDVDLVGEMLLSVGWETLEEGIAEMIALIDTTLAGYVDGSIEDPVIGLIEAYNESATPEGITNALTKAGASDEVLSSVQSLVAGGLPAGIVLRVTKAGLRGESLDVDQMLSDLEALYAENPDISPGLAANTVTVKGSYKHQEQEENVNGPESEGENEEREENENAPGNGNSKGKGNNSGNSGSEGKKG